MKTLILSCLILFIPFTSWADDHIRVVEPYKNEDFSCTGKRDGRLFSDGLDDSQNYGYGKFRMLADLNFDGKQDIILSNGWCGNSECNASIFLKQSDRSYLKLKFGVQPNATRLKKTNEGEGNLILFGPAGGGEVAFAYYKIILNSISFESSKIVKPNDLEENWLQHLGESLKVEFAWCQNEEIKWSSNYQ
jgi:hypothetical protein